MSGRRRHGRRTPRGLRVGTPARGQGRTRTVCGGPRVQGAFPPGGRGRPPGQRGLHRAGRRRRPRRRTPLDGHPLRPRPHPRRPGETERSSRPGRTAPAHRRTRRGPARHPPRRCRPPRSQAQQRPAHRHRPQGHRLRHLPARRQRSAHRDRQAHRLTAVHGARAVPTAARGGPRRRRLRARLGPGARGDRARPVRLRQPVHRGVPGRPRRTGSDGGAGGVGAARRALPRQGSRRAADPGPDDVGAAAALVRGGGVHTGAAATARPAVRRRGRRAPRARALPAWDADTPVRATAPAPPRRGHGSAGCVCGRV